MIRPASMLACGLVGRPAFFFLERRAGVEAVAVCSSRAVVARDSCMRSHTESQASLVMALRVCRVLCVFLEQRNCVMF